MHDAQLVHGQPRCGSWIHDVEIWPGRWFSLQCQDAAGHDTAHQWADRSGSPLIVWPTTGLARTTIDRIKKEAGQ